MDDNPFEQSVREDFYLITYYLGNVQKKRAYFRSHFKDNVGVDNCDVTASLNLNGKECIVLGDIPFGNMRVGEYICYSRALTEKLPLTHAAAKMYLRRAGLKVSINAKLGQMDRLTFRLVLLSAALRDEVKDIWLNLDGIAYSPVVASRIKRTLKKIEGGRVNLNVAVSDYRLVPKKAKAVTVTSDGKVADGIVKFCARNIGRLKFSRSKIKRSFALSMLSGKTALLCDN